MERSEAINELASALAKAQAAISPVPNNLVTRMTIRGSQTWRPSGKSAASR